MPDLANASPRSKSTCRRQLSGLGGWGRAVAIATVNREKAPKFKGAANEMSLTPLALNPVKFWPVFFYQLAFESLSLSFGFNLDIAPMGEYFT